MSGTGTTTGSMGSGMGNTGSMGAAVGGGGITRPNSGTDGAHGTLGPGGHRAKGHGGSGHGGSGHGSHGHDTDLAPGEESHHDVAKGVQGYLLGLAFAVALTLASFGVVHSAYVWAPAIPVALIVFAVAQMGVHLVFFLHITTGADNTNNIMALAFGILIVFLVVGGSLWIMAHLNGNMTMPMDQLMQMQR